MKKILLIISLVVVFSIPAICQDAWEIYVEWDDQNCDCLGTTSNNYFKINIVVYDEANEVTVEPGITTTTPDATQTEDIIATSNVESYCGQIHPETPVFTIRVQVWLMETYTNPETVCCSGSTFVTDKTCSDFEDGISIPLFNLN